MSDLKSSIVSDVARPQPSAAKGNMKDGKALPVEAGKEVEGNLSSHVEKTQDILQLKEDGPVKDSQLKEAVTQMQDYMQNLERNLNFQLDEESGITVIRVFDTETEELIRQIPNEEAVSLAQKLNEEEPLMLFSAKV